VLDGTAQRDAAAFDPDLHVAGPLEQLERVVEEILDFLIVGRPERSAAPNRDGREQRGHAVAAVRNARWRRKQLRGRDAGSGHLQMAAGPAETGRGCGRPRVGHRRVW